MSEVTLDPAVIKKTQEILGKYVKKPALSEKLLKKPPFRFLHDVINAIIKTTNVFATMYSNDELNAENIKDRDSKMEFLQKLIDVVKLSTNEKISVRASKIVAGHVPEKTNELLQLIGKILDEKIDCSGAIETVKNGGLPKTKPKPKEKDAKTNAGREGKVEKIGKKGELKDKGKPERGANKLVKTISIEKEKKAKSVVGGKRESPPGKSITKSVESNKGNKTADKALTKSERVLPAEPGLNREGNSTQPSGDELQGKFRVDSSKETTEMEKPNEEGSLKDTNGSRKSSSSSRKSSAGNQSRRSSVDRRSSLKEEVADIDAKKILTESPNKTLEKITEDVAKQHVERPPHPAVIAAPISPAETPLEREPTFVRQDTKDALPARPRTSLRPPSARPASARPGAPRRRDKNVEIVLQPNEHVKLGGINVKIEAFNADLEDDGENLVVIENSSVVDGKGNGNKTADIDEEAEDAQQGHLVQQILETQKELVQSHSDERSDKDNHLHTIRKRQSSAKQMDTLRDVIQNLTKSINPLGKLMDFIPEDVDAMQLEQTMWKDNYTQAANELRKEKSLTESSTEPMKNTLLQIEANIKEYAEMIDISRAKILQNSEKVFNLLTEQ